MSQRSQMAKSNNNSPTTTTGRRSHQESFISLSKLKNYMTRSDLDSQSNFKSPIQMSCKTLVPDIVHKHQSNSHSSSLMTNSTNPTTATDYTCPTGGNFLKSNLTTDAMQALSAVSHSSTNQLISAGLNQSAAAMAMAAESHLDNLNHHYMSGNNASGVALSALSAGNANHMVQNYNNYTSQQQQHQSQTTGAASLALGAHQQHNQTSDNDHVAYNHIQHHHGQHLHQQQSPQQQQAQSNMTSQQESIYHQIANSAVAAGGNLNYVNTSAHNAHYNSQLQQASNQASNLVMTEAHQSQLNTAAAACAAAAVVSQTLKTVANQHHQHHYGGSGSGGAGSASIANGFGASGLVNMATNQHHHQQQQFHASNGLSQNHHQHHHHQLSQNQNTSIQISQHHHHQLQQQHHHHQQSQQLSQSLPVHQSSIATRKYQCKMCPQVFMSKAEMKYHNQNHLREAKPYKCLQCPKTFANSSYLSQHMRIHQGLKPYTCDICARRFTQLSHLQQHKRTHTGDKPYKCNYMNCTKQFSQLSNLQSHSRCHQSDRPFRCNSCYKCFFDEQSLLEHIPRHLESKHLKRNLCIFCGSSYQQERGLVKHFQQYHTDKTPTLVAAAIAAGTTGNTSLIASLVSTTQPKFATPSSGSTSSSSSSSISSSSSSGNSIGHGRSLVNTRAIDNHSTAGGIGANLSSSVSNPAHSASSATSSGSYHLGSGFLS